MSHDYTKRRARGATGDPTSAYHRRRRDRHAAAANPSAPVALDAVIDPENLLAAYHELRARGGHAPGPDGVTFAGVGPREAASLTRLLARVITWGHYAPGPARKVPIAKPDGSHRILSVGNLTDRVVSRALYRTLAPLWESVFLPTSYGFRPGRGTWNLLADLVTRMTAEKRYVLAVDDVHHAFDNVDIGLVMEVHEKYINDTELLDLIGSVLRGEDQNRTVGIAQGDPYSPAALNVLLHHVHDAPLAGVRRQPPGYRYADNVVYLCRSVSEGHQALERSRHLLANAGLTLKGKDGPPVDLKQNAEVQILGFSVKLKDGMPHLGPGEDATRGLKESLDDAHLEPDPPGAARLAVQGWIQSQGPAFERQPVADTVDNALRTAASRGFRELASREELAGWAGDALRRWEALRRGAERRTGTRPGLGTDPRGGSAAHRRNGPVS